MITHNMRIMNVEAALRMANKRAQFCEGRGDREGMSAALKDADRYYKRLQELGARETDSISN